MSSDDVFRIVYAVTPDADASDTVELLSGTRDDGSFMVRLQLDLQVPATPVE